MMAKTAKTAKAKLGEAELSEEVAQVAGHQFEEVDVDAMDVDVDVIITYE